MPFLRCVLCVSRTLALFASLALYSLTLTTVRARRLASADRRHPSRPTSRRAVARNAYLWAASAFILEEGRGETRVASSLETKV